MRIPVRLGLVIGIALAGFSIASRSSAQLTYNPIVTTGYDVDIIFEAGLGEGATGATGAMGQRQFYEIGISGAVPDRGLPRTIPFTSTVTGSTINMGLAPFEGNNIIQFDSTTNATAVKTMTLTTPAAFTNLAIAFSGGDFSNATTSMPQNGYLVKLGYKINFASGAPQTGDVTVSDWGVATAAAGTEKLINADRTRNNITAWTLVTTPTPWAGTASATRWSIYVAEVALTNTANIQNIEFTSYLNDGTTTVDLTATTGTETAAAGRDTAVFGIAGAIGGGPTFNASDYDHAGGVTAADLTILKNNFGTGTTNALGDGEKDGDVDGNDFLLWQRNVGNTSAVATAGVVPEPTAAALAIIGLAALAGCRGRRS